MKLNQTSIPVPVPASVITIIYLNTSSSGEINYLNSNLSFEGKELHTLVQIWASKEKNPNKDFFLPILS